MRWWAAVALALMARAASAGLLVTEVVGRAEVEGQGAVNTLAEIPEGARLAVAAGARVALVHLKNGREFLLKDGGRYVVTAEGIEGAGGKAVEVLSLPVANLPAVRVVPSRVAQAAVVMKEVGLGRPGLGEILEEESWLVSPVDTTVITDMPAFAWNAVPGAGRYILTVMAPDGATRWAGSTGETRAALPADLRLAPGSGYTWKVEAMQAGKPLATATATFSVAPAGVMERLARLKPGADAPFARRVLYAAQLREAGATEEAKRMWTALSHERPDDAVLRRLARP
ncbi:MAG: hypothetical protein ROZ00_03645 [Denitratisoma sp.]|nr:hypothetical protein [Denitratisoma sp.]